MTKQLMQKEAQVKSSAPSGPISLCPSASWTSVKVEVKENEIRLMPCKAADEQAARLNDINAQLKKLTENSQELNGQTNELTKDARGQLQFKTACKAGDMLEAFKIYTQIKEQLAIVFRLKTLQTSWGHHASSRASPRGGTRPRDAWSVSPPRGTPSPDHAATCACARAALPILLSGPICQGPNNPNAPLPSNAPTFLSASRPNTRRMATVRQLQEALRAKDGEIQVLKRVDVDRRKPHAEGTTPFDERHFGDDLQAKDQCIKLADNGPRAATPPPPVNMHMSLSLIGKALLAEAQRLSLLVAGVEKKQKSLRQKRTQKELSESTNNCIRLQEENKRIRLDLERTHHDLGTSHEKMATRVETIDKMHAALVEDNGRLLGEVDKTAPRQAAKAWPHGSRTSTRCTMVKITHLLFPGQRGTANTCEVDALSTECAALKEECDK
ncbi:unnamed protein product [Vitrella brassicaformis CCMP3155]|uniref:Uncharacterized protein n=1 Tax=Vitrella brassicaformis (strain CCMP3155) TaxID=1169540 RepID=A0A0G4H6E1_VITBC|nr:unnamed protein product [Vitrella brassicaformis CCMP3155]|eukprot:CEM39405.1 unnamed protein product [Vitrella brassicaformis CCMP3155]